MKKFVAVSLVFAILFTLFAFSAGAEDKDALTFAVATDMHYKTVDTIETLNPASELFFHAEPTGNLHAESGAIIDAFLAQEANSESEFILVCGDMCTNEVASDERIVTGKFAEFERATGKQIYVINGNHDIKNNGMTVDSFCDIYRDFGYDEALVRDDTTCSYTADLNDEYRLIAIDSCSHGKTGDGIDTRLLGWIKTQCDSAASDGKRIIAIMHHNLLSHYIPQKIAASAYMVKNSELIASLFASWGIYCVFTGHEHSNDVAYFINPCGKKVYDVTTTSLGASPVEYRTATFTENEITLKMREVEAIDTSSLAAKGFTQAQINAVNADFTAYADEYFKAGLRTMFKTKLSAAGLGIDASSALYPVADKALKSIDDFINMPLYPVGTENSAASVIAARYGVTLPESGYATGYELVYAVMKAHYTGNESFGADSVENSLLLALVDAALYYALDGVGTAYRSEFIDALFSKLNIDTAACGVNVYSTTSKILNTVLHPIAVAFASVSGPSDRDVIIPAYETADAQTAFMSIFTKLREFFEMIILSVKYLFR